MSSNSASRLQPRSATTCVAITPPLPGLRAELSGAVDIVPDEATNTLLVRATSGDWAIIEEAIQLVDLRPLQVVIEVVIPEVRHTREAGGGRIPFRTT
ncbi:hypothetical protein BH23GEM9_BH23GEM9_26970 [soil metagenome]